MYSYYFRWVVKGLLALLLVGAGLMKLAGIPEVHKSFSILGLPAWFGYFLGLIEAVLAFAVFVSPVSRKAILSAFTILLGAICFHLVHTPVSEAGMALFGWLMCLYLILTERKISKESPLS